MLGWDDIFDALWAHVGPQIIKHCLVIGFSWRVNHFNLGVAWEHMERGIARVGSLEACVPPKVFSLWEPPGVIGGLVTSDNM